MEDFLKVGIITSTHGIKGEVKVYPTTDDAFTREPPGPKSQRVYLVARECQKKNGGFQ